MEGGGQRVCCHPSQIIGGGPGPPGPPLPTPMHAIYRYIFPVHQIYLTSSEIMEIADEDLRIIPVQSPSMSFLLTAENQYSGEVIPNHISHHQSLQDLIISVIVHSI